MPAKRRIVRREFYLRTELHSKTSQSLLGKNVKPSIKLLAIEFLVPIFRNPLQARVLPQVRTLQVCPALALQMARRRLENSKRPKTIVSRLDRPSSLATVRCTWAPCITINRNFQSKVTTALINHLMAWDRIRIMAVRPIQPLQAKNSQCITMGFRVMDPPTTPSLSVR